ncbi:hypothetical protein N7474_004987 [Penicillium riverlandense]|uniref:uncharacterized protein n=1 Tax=Penicillium riverlandense TaxID=1903569 RepID=UPI00254894C1|nr:uncharacterized protein N7474_004987 [Penicillium riverlandense]KAJ5819396.1 hypothetical protein N7474_004987 [Penicillium riverlandense]
MGPGRGSMEDVPSLGTGAGSWATTRPGPGEAAEEIVSGLRPAVPAEESSAASHSAESVESVVPCRQRGSDHAVALPHFLLRCTLWDEQRRTLIEAAGAHFGSLPQMLGGKPENVDGACESNRRAWEPDIKVVRAVLAYAMET